jgi:carbamate kinase
MPRLAVIAIGGNSLIRDESHRSVTDQYDAVVETTHHIAGMVEQGYDVVITHGNGPQVGFILLRSEIAEKAAGLHAKEAVTVVTQVLVDREDPAFSNPSKPVGSFYSKEEIQEKVAKEGWNVVEDAGRGWRRVVASPMPIQVIELDAILDLVKAGFVVVAAGGGGIPVVKDENDNLKGVAAVIDKDHATSLLATNLNADLFVISTAVEKVYINYNKPDQQGLDRMTISEAKTYMGQGQFAKGSMLPKVKAAISFLEHGGKEALITNPESLERAVAGKTGTKIVHD